MEKEFIFPYKTSRDYAMLKRLLDERVNVVVLRHKEIVTMKKRSDGGYSFAYGNSGITIQPGLGDDEDRFGEGCEYFDIEFIEPTLPL